MARLGALRAMPPSRTPMTKERKHAILFAATLLRARKLIETIESDKPNLAKLFFVDRAIQEAEFILERIDRKWPQTYALAMKVIYIEKKWLDMIGDIKDILLIRSEDGDYISVLAQEKKMEINFPFVEANLIRKLDTDDDEYLLPAKIPVSLISGIFDLTRTEAENKYGFVRRNRKKKT